VSLATPVMSSWGQVVFRDDFSDPASGWYTGTTTDATAGYGLGGLVATVSGPYYHQLFAPYDEPIDQVGISMTATLSAGAPTGTGVGVVCGRGGTGSTAIRYDFILIDDSKWTIVRHTGASQNGPVALKSGTAAVTPGATSVTVAGMCASQPDNRTTRLIMFVNGSSVTDLTDTAPTFTDPGWLPGIGIRSQSSQPATVTVSDFQVSDLAF
jgi:hypothetical protein